jgi:hypothetical protein
MASLRGDWRIGRGTLVRLVKHDSMDSVPIPLAEDVMFAWFSDLGWRPELSPPGLLAKQIYRQLEGHLFALHDEKLLGLFEYMNGGKVQRDGRPVSDNTIQPELERDREVGEVKNRSGGSYDYLVSRGVFRLGNHMQCPLCLRNSWFPANALGDTFTCPRCSRSFPAIGSLTSGAWTYKTTGPFSVAGYADGAYAVLLSVEFFSERKMAALHTTPVLSFKATSAQRKDLEADFALLWQESLYGEERDGVVFGECKTYGEFHEKDFDRMQYLAKTFPGAVLVFSTLRKSLTAREIGKIARITKAGRKHWKADRPINPVLILTGTELLDWQGPPYCWSDDLRQKFDRVHGLLEICDATQQIYLNLPSWHMEWNERREKLRKRRVSKMERKSEPKKS